MILGYMKMFAWKKPTHFKRKIQEGIKKHTIRADIKNRWREGLKIQHAHGVRTKYYEQFGEDICKSVQKIGIYHRSGEVFVKIDGAHFYNSMQVNYNTLRNITDLAKNDGFDTVEDFFRWFDKDFEGKIIHWTDLRY